MAGQQQGVTLGAYQIIDQIGLGGMATVYKAYQPNMERYVALKVLPQHYARDPNFVERFMREARTIAGLEHRNILPVYDFGEDKGVTYMTMRYLEGGTLKDILELGRLTLADAADLLEQVAAALDYAHRQGVVHRDVKPANIMVDSEGWTYLTDFGIAKVLEGTSELTQGAIGTPAYMAPEQAKGDAIDGRADIYALGVILYELVTGQVPYMADTPMAVALAHIHEPLPIPSVVDPNVPEPLERVILKALAKNPDDRYQTANEFALAMQAAVREAAVDKTDTRLQVLAEEVRDSMDRLTAPVTEESFADPLSGVGLPRTGMEAPTVDQAITSRRGLPMWVWPVIAVMGIAIIAGAILLGTGVLGGGSPEASDVPSSGPAQSSDTEEGTGDTEGSVEEPASASAASVNFQVPEEGMRVEGCNERADRFCIVSAKDDSLLAEYLADADPPYQQVHGMAFSPDGQQIAFGASQEQVEGADNLLYIMDMDSTIRQSHNLGGNVVAPSWSPDGEWIAIHLSGDLAIVKPDGSGLTRLNVADIGDCTMFHQWSPDSKKVVATVQPQSDSCMNDTEYNVTVFDVEMGDSTILESVAKESSTCNDANVAFSPDGTQVAYQGSDCAYYLANVDGSGTAVLDGDFPYWWTSSYYPQWGREGYHTGQTWFVDDFEDEEATVESWALVNQDYEDTVFGNAITFQEEGGNTFVRLSAEGELAPHMWLEEANSDPAQWQDYALMFRFRRAAGSEEGITIYSHNTERYLLKVNVSGDGISAHTEIDHADAYQLGRSSTQIADDEWHTIRIEVLANFAAVFLDGQKIVNGVVDDAFDPGSVAVLAHNTTVDIDDVWVVSLKALGGSAAGEVTRASLDGVTISETTGAGTWPAGETHTGDGDVVWTSQSDNPVDVFEGKSVFFLGPNQTGNDEIRVVYQIEFDQPAELQQVTFTFVGLNGHMITVRDSTGRDMVRRGPFEEGNVEQTLTLDLPSSTGTIYEIEITNLSTDWMYIGDIQLVYETVN